MYVVKEDVDLKEFERFGFVEYKDWNGEIFYYRDLHSDYDKKYLSGRLFARKKGGSNCLYLYVLNYNFYNFGTKEINFLVELYIQMIEAGLIERKNILVKV